MITSGSSLTSYDSNIIKNVKDELINEAKDTIKYLSGDKDADNSENN
mgnify:FL=1